MIKVKNKKKFSIFLLIVLCFFASGAYLIFIAVGLLRGDSEESKPELGATYQEGVAKLSEGDFESASDYLEKSIEEDSSPEKIKMLAVSQYNQKKYTEAEANFEKLLKEDKENSHIYYNSLANIYRDQGDFEKAIEYYEKSIKEKKDYETAYQNLAILYLYEIEPADEEKANEVISRGLEEIPESEVLKKMQQ